VSLASIWGRGGWGTPEFAGHTSLATTQKYIQGDTAAKRNVMKLI
jgi:hypothetical protein